MTPDIDRVFLGALTPWITVLARYIIYKAQFRGIGGALGPSLLLSYCLHRNEWGSHPVSQPPINNLSLLEAPTKWSGRATVVGGVRYRTYKTWLDWVTDYSDHLVFPGYYDAALAEREPGEQARIFCRITGTSYDTLRSIVEIVAREREQCLDIPGSSQTF